MKNTQTLILNRHLSQTVQLQWAYGVTCWEIFTGGKVPYPSIHPRDLPQKLEEGHRMEKPENAACTEDV